MAFSATKATSYPRRHSIQTVWALADTAGNGLGESFPGCRALSFQATGTFASGTVTITGSNDGTNYIGLGTAVAFANAAGLKGVALLDLGFQFYRPELTGGGGTTAVTVTAVAVGCGD
jgi:hypothetical protein